MEHEHKLQGAGGTPGGLGEFLFGAAMVIAGGYLLLTQLVTHARGVIGMTVAEQLVSELTREAASTRRLLERLPEEKLGWKPHPKSMTLGQLAYHIAVLPMAIAELASELIREAPQPPRPQPASVAEIISTLDKSIAAATAKVSSWSDADLGAIWRLTREGRTMLEIPRVDVIRSVMLNHGYHHRGQLTVYLRLLDVALSSIYGPTADENLFG